MQNKELRMLLRQFALVALCVLAAVALILWIAPDALPKKRQGNEFLLSWQPEGADLALTVETGLRHPDELTVDVEIHQLHNIWLAAKEAPGESRAEAPLFSDSWRLKEDSESFTKIIPVLDSAIAAHGAAEAHRRAVRMSVTLRHSQAGVLHRAILDIPLREFQLARDAQAGRSAQINIGASGFVKGALSPTKAFDFGAGPVPAHRHSNGGGWVADTAQVARSAYVGEDARVYGNARVKGQARVISYARVFGNAEVAGGATVGGDARVYGNARVLANAHIRDEAKVYQAAVVYGSATIFGNARVYGNARVFGRSHVYNDAQVGGRARIFGEASIGENHLVSGHRQISGGYFD